MKRMLLTACVLALGAMTALGQSQTTIHYWHFNDGPGSGAWPITTFPANIGDGVITHTFNPDNVMDFAGSTENAEPGVAAGGSFSVQGGDNTENNGEHFELEVPTTGADDIVFSYATRGTGTGFDTHTVDYSTDDGASWTQFDQRPANQTATWQTFTYDFSAIAAVNDNADFRIRVHVDGATGATGNNRFDNVKVVSGEADDVEVDHLAFVNVPEEGFASQSLASFSVEARDDEGQVVTTFSGDITLSKGMGPGSISGTLVRAAVNGVATFTDIRFDLPGTYTIIASIDVDPPVDPVESSEIEIEEAPELPAIIAYWNFNDTDNHLEVSAGRGQMSTSVHPDNVVDFTGVTLNRAFDFPAGRDAAFQGGPETNGTFLNNGSHITWHVSTSEYEEITLSVAHQRSGTGFNNNTFQYSVDGGDTWVDFEVGFDPPTSRTLRVFDLRAVEAVDNQSDLRLRIVLDGASAAAGNYRIDNVRINGSPIADAEATQFVDNVGQYAFPGTDVSMNFSSAGTDGDVIVSLFEHPESGIGGRTPEDVMLYSMIRFWRITAAKTGYSADVTFTVDPAGDDFTHTDFLAEEIVLLHRDTPEDRWALWPKTSTDWDTDGTTYTITAQNVQAFSEWTIGSEAITSELPIELASFDAAIDGRDAVLTWKTASETNNAGFHIQRRTGEGFADVGFVEGAGTDAEGRAYSYRVADLSPGTHSFRLRQVDFDGAASYSSVLDVTVELAEAYELTSAYPNPFNPQTSFRLTVAQEQHVTINVYDVLGRQVAVLHDGLMPANESQTFTFEAGNLSSGLYLYRVEGETFAETRRMTLLK